MYKNQKNILRDTFNIMMVMTIPVILISSYIFMLFQKELLFMNESILYDIFALSFCMLGSIALIGAIHIGGYGYLIGRNRVGYKANEIKNTVTLLFFIPVGFLILSIVIAKFPVVYISNLDDMIQYQKEVYKNITPISIIAYLLMNITLCSELSFDKPIKSVD